MRVFGRFLYALLAVGLFLLVWQYSMDLTANRFYEEVFGASLTDEDSDLPEFYYFYTSIPDFHKSDPIISVSIDGYEIRGYEVARAKINNNNQIEVTEAVYIIVYSEVNSLFVLDKITVYKNNTSTEANILLSRFKRLNILNGINDQQTVYIPKSLFLESEFDRIKIVDFEGEVVIETDFTIEPQDFTIKENLETFYQEYDKVPDKDDFINLQDSNIAYRVYHINDQNQLDGSIMLVAMVTYFLVLIITTYLIFFKKKKYGY